MLLVHCATPRKVASDGRVIFDQVPHAENPFGSFSLSIVKGTRELLNCGGEVGNWDCPVERRGKL